MRIVRRGARNFALLNLIGTFGCTLIAGLDHTYVLEGTASESQGVSGTSVGAGGAGDSGGHGGAAQLGCLNPAADCPAPLNECSQPTCEAEQCSTKHVPEGMEAPTQVKGDCKHILCDGAGDLISANDDADVPDDMNICTEDSCNNGSAVHEPVSAGTECAQGGGKRCNAAGECVPCLVGGDCVDSTLVCIQNLCVPVSCNNATKDEMETDTDCGGPDCPACATGDTCNTASDCTSMVCARMECQPESCTDDVKNQGESDVDCGGVSCGGCDNGKTCVVDVDCKSSDCVNGVCDESCSDDIVTGLETDIDCGGPLCPDCTEGKKCIKNSDCLNGLCVVATCQSNNPRR